MCVLYQMHMYCTCTLYLSSQRLLEEAEKTPNVVKGTNRKGLYEELEDIQGRFVHYIHSHTCTVL